MIEMAKNMLFWLKHGVDGFRADAIPYLWKKEGTDCENLPQTHTLVKFFRAVLDYVRPNTLLLAEACQKPYKVVEYFGDGDECNAGYHFPLMPQLFKSVAMQNNEPIISTLSKAVTPDIPEGSQWLTFLRCHDELSLELVYVTEEDRKYIHDHYCRQPQWDFRFGQGISARLSELMERDPARICLIASIMMTLPGTPVIYYGDEFGKVNDLDYYKQKIVETGKDDSRFLVRGRIDWNGVEKDLQDPDSLASNVYKKMSTMMQARKQYNKAFGRGCIDWVPVPGKGSGEDKSILMFSREYEGEQLLIVHNLSAETKKVTVPPGIQQRKDLLNQAINITGGKLTIEKYGCNWLSL